MAGVLELVAALLERVTVSVRNEVAVGIERLSSM